MYLSKYSKEQNKSVYWWQVKQVSDWTFQNKSLVQSKEFITIQASKNTGLLEKSFYAEMHHDFPEDPM